MKFLFSVFGLILSLVSFGPIAFASDIDGSWITRTKISSEVYDDDGSRVEVWEHYKFIMVKISQDGSVCSAFEAIVLNGEQKIGSSMSCKISGDDQKSLTIRNQGLLLPRHSGKISVNRDGGFVITSVLHGEGGRPHLNRLVLKKFEFEFESNSCIAILN